MLHHELKLKTLVENPELDPFENDLVEATPMPMPMIIHTSTYIAHQSVKNQ
jgi:hypothetical protein